MTALCVAALVAALARPPAPPSLAEGQDVSPAELRSGQELIYRGRFSAAALYFERMSREHPREPAAPVLLASALIWWGEARDEESFLADSVDLLLTEGITRAARALVEAPTDTARVQALFWLGSAYGYRARQAEARGSFWRASRDARVMRQALERAVALDSTCVDCLLGLGLYDYSLARSGALARLIARIVGLGGGDAERGLDRMRRSAETGLYTRSEARWVYAHALLRESGRDAARREQALRLVAELAAQFPENSVFQRGLPLAPADP